jgi:hypothetical protein
MPQKQPQLIRCPHCDEGFHPVGTDFCPNTGMPLKQKFLNLKKIIILFMIVNGVLLFFFYQPDNTPPKNYTEEKNIEKPDYSTETSGDAESKNVMNGGYTDKKEDKPKASEKDDKNSSEFEKSKTPSDEELKEIITIRHADKKEDKPKASEKDDKNLSEVEKLKTPSDEELIKIITGED